MRRVAVALHLLNALLEGKLSDLLLLQFPRKLRELRCELTLQLRNLLHRFFRRYRQAQLLRLQLGVFSAENVDNIGEARELAVHFVASHCFCARITRSARTDKNHVNLTQQRIMLLRRRRLQLLLSINRVREPRTKSIPLQSQLVLLHNIRCVNRCTLLLYARNLITKHHLRRFVSPQLRSRARRLLLQYRSHALTLALLHAQFRFCINSALSLLAVNPLQCSNCTAKLGDQMHRSLAVLLQLILLT